MREIKCYLFFLLSLAYLTFSRRPSESAYVVANGRVFFLCYSRIVFLYDHNILIYLPINEHLGYLQFLASVNHASVNMGVNASFPVSAFAFFR